MGNGSACSKGEGKPVWSLLGGEEGGRVDVYASTGEVHPPAQRVEEVLRLQEMGFKSVKLRVHSFDPAEDVEQVAAVRAAVGDSMEIGVDANQGWRVALVADAPLWDLERATDFARACSDLAGSVTRPTPGPTVWVFWSTCTAMQPGHGPCPWSIRTNRPAGCRKRATESWRSLSWWPKTAPLPYPISPDWGLRLTRTDCSGMRRNTRR